MTHPSKSLWWVFCCLWFFDIVGSTVLPPEPSGVSRSCEKSPLRLDWSAAGDDYA